MNNEKRPQPVNWAARITSAATVLFNGTPPLLIEFEYLDWTVNQLAAWEAFVGGVLIAALGIMLGQRSSREVTPTSDPRDNALVPLVPIANDSLED